MFNGIRNSKIIKTFRLIKNLKVSKINIIVKFVFQMVWLYTNELYPTNLRTQAIGTCSMLARAVGLSAPFIGTLAKYWQPLPLLLLGIPTCIAGIMAGFLPETRGKHLPQTMSQADRLFTGSSTLPKLISSESICMNMH